MAREARYQTHRQMQQPRRAGRSRTSPSYGLRLAPRRKLVSTLLEAVYVDMKESRAIVAIKPKAQVRPIFQVASAREGSGVMLVNEPPDSDPEARRCFCGRRGSLRFSAEHLQLVLLTINRVAPVCIP